MLQAWAEDERVCGALARILYVDSKGPETHNMHKHTQQNQSDVHPQSSGGLEMFWVQYFKLPEGNYTFKMVTSGLGHMSITAVIHLI